ncbi:MAG TPA: hypothetical protein VFS00_30730, partial [Polyangiaceae bacterium]|nr:hypothetical protein [Polyangiaceae bacterium]
MTSCSDDGAAPNAPAGPAEGYVIEVPAAGQTLITGTTRRVAWRGGDPAEKVDIRFLPKSGEPVSLAAGVDNTGSLEVSVRLLADHLRGGGSVEVVSAGASTPSGAAPAGPAQGEGGRRVPVRVGSVAGFSWNGTAEEYYWLDVTTGAKQPVGTVGDLTTWATKTVAVDYDAELIYVIGFSGDEQKLYVLEAKSGALVRSVPLAREGAAGRDQSTYLGVTFA